MSTRRTPRSMTMGVAGVSALLLAVAGCSAPEAEDGTVTLTYLVDNGQETVDLNNALIEEFEASHEDIRIELQTRPPGSEGDNLIKTKLATGEMEDMFFYNSGSLLQGVNPDQNLVNLADEPWVDKLDENFATTVSTENGLYGVPGGQSSTGAITYNKDIYADLGLEIPRTWDEFMANNQAILDAGEAAPVIQTYGDTWSAQVPILGDFYNVTQADPEWAEQFTANEVNYAEEPAISSFEKLQELHEGDFFNEDFASATYDDGIRMVSTGEGAHYPILSFAATAVAGNYPDAVDAVGIFPIPGEDAETNGLTAWMPSATYIPLSTEEEKLEAAKAFLEFMTTPEACSVMSEQIAPTGPFVVEGCDLPEDVPAIVSDMQPYFDEGRTSLALEFLSPVKGPALEQIAVSVGSGITDAQEGAEQYDSDVEKQAQQLGLENW